MANQSSRHLTLCSMAISFLRCEGLVVMSSTLLEILPPFRRLASTIPAQFSVELLFTLSLGYGRSVRELVVSWANGGGLALAGTRRVSHGRKCRPKWRVATSAVPLGAATPNMGVAL